VSSRRNPIAFEGSIARQAAAVSYENSEEGAVVAAGRGALASLIVSLAKEHNVPIAEDSDLVERLMSVTEQAPLSVELLEAISEVLSLLATADEQYATKREHR
jgi:flagellar biosynthesis protein